MDFFRILNFSGYLLLFLEAQPLDIQVIDVSTLSEKAQDAIKLQQIPKTKLPQPTAWPKLNLDPDKSTLVYIHIPKTAGTTFKSKIDAVTQNIDIKRNSVYQKFDSESNQNTGNPHLEWYPDSHTHSWLTPGCMKHLGDETHCGFSEIRSCINAHQATLNYSKLDTIKYFSVVRDPVERVISEYFYWKNIASPGTGAWSTSLKQASENFTSWILHADNSAHNSQFKSFVDFPDIGNPEDRWESGRKRGCLNSKGDWFVEYWFGKLGWKHQGLSDLELTANVFNNIQRNFGFIGVFEKMEESVDALTFLLGGEIERTNVEKPRKTSKSHSSKKRRNHCNSKRIDSGEESAGFGVVQICSKTVELDEN